MKAVAHGWLIGIFALALATSTLAQESKSAALAKELTDAFDKAKSSVVAAKDPSQPDVFMAAMYFPGTLLVVSAKYSVPALINGKIAKKDYQEVYIDLQSASDPGTKIFIQDLGADGLKFKTFDTVDSAKGSTVFDGDWKKAKAASEQEYQKSFADADDQYVKMLTTLLAAIKQTS